MKKILCLLVFALALPWTLAGDEPSPLSRPPIQAFLGHGFGTLNEKAPPETEQFGRLVGLWRVETEMATQGGSFVATAPGFWVWKYTLDGFAVSDLWYQGADGLPTYMANLGRDYLLTTNRIYNVREKKWNVYWMANGAGKVMGADTGTFTAVLEDDAIVMTSGPGGFGLQRVVFSDFTENSFRWSSDYSPDDGKTWNTVMRMAATRIETP